MPGDGHRDQGRSDGQEAAAADGQEVRLTSRNVGPGMSEPLHCIADALADVTQSAAAAALNSLGLQKDQRQPAKKALKTPLPPPGPPQPSRRTSSGCEGEGWSGTRGDLQDRTHPTEVTPPAGQAIIRVSGSLGCSVAGAPTRQSTRCGPGVREAGPGFTRRRRPAHPVSIGSPARNHSYRRAAHRFLGARQRRSR